MLTMPALPCLILGLLGPPQQGAGAVPTELPWDAARAEHLWNRAGFGADARTIARTLELGPAATVEELLAADPWIEPPFYARKRNDGMRELARRLPEEMREEKKKELREEDKAQMADFQEWWVGRMLDGEEPLRERMTLFWHGHFASSMETVKSSFEMIQQNQLFRRHALGSFRELLHGVARDPAMLIYLDNTSSRKGNPNENFARELLELFTLGEGNYTEEDVREVARAFTGWGQRNGHFRLEPRQHDGGTKRVLGVEGKLDGDDVLEIVLDQPACARHVAAELLRHFEGLPPAPERLERYAGVLRESGYRIDALLRALFLDPDFYRAEVLGQRVRGPFEFLVGSARRLGAHPEPRQVVAGAALLGQKLFFPPNVSGWEEGRAWITTSGLLLRAQIAGLMTGTVRGRDLAAELEREEPEAGEMEPEPAPEAAAGDEPARRRRLPADLRALVRTPARPRLNLGQRMTLLGAVEDGDIARALLEELLAVPVAATLEEDFRARLEAARDELGLEPGALLARPELAEPLLRRLAHEILSLPEAQLD